ncbi:MAG: cupin protein [Clostridia bacterium]|jgi:quercetin dioxygenase-like cupin family protein|nr:cupin protein [Clostridia bacterium]
MQIKIVNLEDIEKQELPGRTLQWITTPDTVGTKMMSGLFMTCAPHSVVRPVHAHDGIEETVFVLQGQGEVWVDGEYAIFKKGDLILFPANSKHQIRNTGNEPFLCYNTFSAVTSPKDYIMYDEDAFAYIDESK